MSVIFLILAAIQAITSLVPIISQIHSLSYERPSERQDYEALVPRIAFGDPVSITEFPYYVALHGCGGAIISDQWVVTAAHCVNNPAYLENIGKYISIGGDNRKNAETVEIGQIFVHPYYADLNGMQINDIALIKLAERLEFNDRIQPLKLPHYQGDMLVQYESGSEHVFIGKGVDENGFLRLMKMDARLLSTEYCYRDSFPVLNNFIAPFMPWLNDSTICSERVQNMPGAGPSDAGSPLVNDGVLVGIASYRTAPGYSRVMFLTNVEFYIPWIISTTDCFAIEEHENLSYEEHEDSTFDKYVDTSYKEHQNPSSSEEHKHSSSEEYEHTNVEETEVESEHIIINDEEVEIDQESSQHISWSSHPLFKKYLYV